MATNYYKLPTVDPDSTLSFPDAVNGLANATDAVLHGVQSGFERKEFDLPTATSERLGGVRIGRGFDVYSDGLLTTKIGSYQLPAATDKVLGGVAIGKNVTASERGEIGIGSGAMANLEANSTTLKIAGVDTEDLADYAVSAANIPTSILSVISNVPTIWKNAQRVNIYDGDAYRGVLITLTPRIKVFYPRVPAYVGNVPAGTSVKQTLSDGAGGSAHTYTPGELGTGRICARATLYATTTAGTYTLTNTYVDYILDLDAATLTEIAPKALNAGTSYIKQNPGYLLV